MHGKLIVIKSIKRSLSQRPDSPPRRLLRRCIGGSADRLLRDARRLREPLLPAQGAPQDHVRTPEDVPQLGCHSCRTFRFLLCTVDFFKYRVAHLLAFRLAVCLSCDGTVNLMST